MNAQDKKYSKYDWQGTQGVGQQNFDCGHCGKGVAPDRGYWGHVQNSNIRGNIWICPNCTLPTMFFDGRQVPGPIVGQNVPGITDKSVEVLYLEARRCLGVGAYTATALLCRKILMHVAVSCKAEPGLNFIEYVDFLSKNNWVPPNGGKWVDQLRTKGNEANHEIKIVVEIEAKQLLRFTEMLLRLVFEFPTLA